MRREGRKNGETGAIIKELLSRGKKISEVAKELGINRQAVYYHTNKEKQAKNGKQKWESDFSKRPRQYNMALRRYGATRDINWKVYNEALVMRGEFILYFDLLEQEKEHLLDMNRGKIGMKFSYSDSLIEMCVIIKSCFKLDYRTTEGICRRIFVLFGLSAPDYTTICKRIKQLEVEVREFASSPTRELAGDGTGRSQSGRGYFREGKYEINARNFVRVVITVDVNTKQVTAVKVIPKQISEVAAMQEIVERNQEIRKVDKFFADRLHDRISFIAKLLANGTDAVIPTRKRGLLQNAKMRLTKLNHKIAMTLDKQKKLMFTAELHRTHTVIQSTEDYDRWRDRRGYGKRSHVENAFSRDVLFFGDKVSSKKAEKAEKEMKVRYTLLNLFMVLAKSTDLPNLRMLAWKMKQAITEETRICQATKMREIQIAA